MVVLIPLFLCGIELRDSATILKCAVTRRPNYSIDTIGDGILDFYLDNWSEGSESDLSKIDTRVWQAIALLNVRALGDAAKQIAGEENDAVTAYDVLPIAVAGKKLPHTSLYISPDQASASMASIVRGELRSCQRKN
jgi:hypothetical protein